MCKYHQDPFIHSCFRGKKNSCVRDRQTDQPTLSFPESRNLLLAWLKSWKSGTRIWVRPRRSAVFLFFFKLVNMIVFSSLICIFVLTNKACMFGFLLVQACVRMHLSTYLSQNQSYVKAITTFRVQLYLIWPHQVNEGSRPWRLK